MRICVAFLLVLLFLSCVPVQAEINPSVDTKPFFCRYTLTDWTPLCPTVGTGGVGTGSTFVNSENNTFYYNTTTNESYIISNQTSFFNTTIGNNLTTFSNYTYFYIVNITQSEMNQTPGPQGPQGIQGIPGPEGPMNLTANMTAGPPGSMNMTPNMTAGPQGEQGEQGPQGIQGIQGIQGVNGTPGAPGEKGDKGDKGDTGATGATGPMNQTPNMTAGPPGADGATGATGPAGLDANVSSMWPVASVYSTTSLSNPNTLLGAGTWNCLSGCPGTDIKRTISGCAASSQYTACTKAYDGLIGTADAQRWIGSANPPQWAIFDLGAVYTINATREYANPTAVNDTYNWTYSTDNSTFSEMYASQSMPYQAWVNRSPASPVTGRYFKIYISAMNPNGWTSFSEVEFYASNVSQIKQWERTA